MKDEPDTRLARQERIETGAAPDSSVELLCNLNSYLPAADAAVRLYYVPYKRLLSAGSFTAYLMELPLRDPAATALEALATLILDDLNNELLPRWLQLVLAKTGGDGVMQQVLVEDRQPRWDNKILLRRAPGL